MVTRRRVPNPNLEERIGSFKAKASSVAEGVGFAGAALGVYTNYVFPKLWFGAYVTAADNAWKVVSHIPGYQTGWEYSIANLIAGGLGYSIGAVVPLVAYKLGKEHHIPSKTAKIGAKIGATMVKTAAKGTVEVAKGVADAVQLFDQALYSAANYIKASIERSKGIYHQRSKPISNNGRLLLRAGAVSLLGLCLTGYAGLQSGYISRTLPPSRPIVSQQSSPATAPIPTPIAAPIAQQVSPQNRFNLSQEAINFLTRVVFGEAGRYDPENNKSPGYTVAEYDSAFMQGAIDISTVIENRSANPTWFRGQDSLLKVVLAKGQFDVVYWKGNEALFFKDKTTKLPEGYMSLPDSALLGYLNTKPITEEEIRTAWTSGNPNDVALYKKKLKLVNEGIGYFMDPNISALREQRVIKPALRKETTFYLNQKVALDADWLRQCMGNVQLEPEREDGDAIVYPWRHTYHRIAGPCKR